MSNFLAIATVTATLTELVYGAVRQEVPGHVPGAVVTHLPPYSKEIELQAPGVNIYLYEVARNPVFENADLPTRQAGGSMLRRPQTALDLYYLFTFHGDDKLLEPQRLMGTVASTLHTYPILTRTLIQSTIQYVDYLKASDLAAQPEAVKLSSVPLTTEDVSKIWSVLFHMPYLLSRVYQASLVLIDEPVTTEQPLPVRRPVVSVAAFREPVIERVNGDGAIVSGGELVLRGRNLQGEGVMVRLNGMDFFPTEISESVLRLPIPEVLAAGVLTIQVVQRRAASGVVSAILRPVVSQIGFEAGKVVVRFEPRAGVMQTAELILNSPAVNVTLTAPSRIRPTNELRFDTSAVPAGTYLARLQFDGAQSLLAVDATGAFSGPRVTVT